MEGFLNNFASKMILLNSLQNVAIYWTTVLQGFPYWRSPPPAENLLTHSPLPPRKIPPPNPPLPPPKVNPPTKQQCSSYKPIKTAFLAAVIAPAPFLF